MLLATLAVVVAKLMDTAGPAAATTQSPVAGAITQLPLPGAEAGACMSYPPTHGRLGKVVFIDPGHGGLDPGVVGPTADGHTLLEKDATLAVASRLATLLRDDGYTVVMARTEDTTVITLSASDSVHGALTASALRRDLAARAACANLAGASVLVSIHFDGYADPAVGGTETFYDPVRPFASANQRLAADLQSALVAALHEPDRGVWTDDQLAAPPLTPSGESYGHLIELGPALPGWVDNPSQMPGALVEPLFITNREEAKLAGDPAGQQRIAEALEGGLLKFLAGPT